MAGVELADVDRLVSSDDRALAQLREALPAAGLDARFLARLARVGERLDDPMRAPMRVWNARRMPEAAAVLARIFVLHDVEQPAAHGAPAAVIVQLPPTRPEWPVVVPPATAAILRAIDQSPTVQEATRTLPGVALDDILQATRDALTRGTLDRD